MTDQVAERLAKRAAVAAGIEDDPELVALLANTAEETADNLEGEYTVPELKEKADAFDIDISGLSLKREIAEAIARNLLEPEAPEDVPAPQASDEQEAPPADEAPVVDDVPEPEEQAESLPTPEAAGPTHVPQLDESEDSRPIEGAGPYVQLRHVTRTLVQFGRGDGETLLDSQQAREYLSKYLRAGYDLLFVEHLGFDANGHMFLFGFGLPNDPEASQEYEEIYAMVRTIGSGNGAITGFRADAFLSSYLAEGYELFKAKQLGLTASGISMLWVLVR